MRWDLPSRASALLICTLLVIAGTPGTGTGRPDSDQSAKRDVIVFFEPDTGIEAITDALTAAGVHAADIDVRRDDMAVVRVDADATASRVSSAIRGAAGVTSMGTDGTVSALESVPPSDPAYLGPTYPQRAYLGPGAAAPNSIQVEPVWEAAFNGERFTFAPGRPGVTVAVIDTGVTPSLLEDTGDYVATWDYVNGDADPSDDSMMLLYHGTRVASAIRAQTDNQAGIAGVLHELDARVLVYKALDRVGAGSSANCMQAMRDAADAGAQVINTSFGERATLANGSTPDSELRAAWQDTVDYCMSKGALVVAASGNDANRYPAYTPVFYPAACDGALAVGSIDIATGLRSDYSCFGPELDVVTPGRFQGGSPVVGLWTAMPNGVSDQTATGTSFAAPLASGTAALLWSLVPGLGPDDIAGLLKQTADNSYGPVVGFDTETGWGLVDAWAAYDEMTRTVSAQAPVSVSASAPERIETRVSWTPASGAGVTYLYGYRGGPTYATPLTSGRLVLPGSGSHEIWVRSFARDRWGAQVDATTSVTVTPGIASLTSTRHAGTDRYATAAAVSRASFPASASSAVIALGTNWPDALTASVLAGQVGGPLLLARRDSVPIATRDELVRLAPSTVYLIGGTSAVSKLAEDQLAAILPPGAQLIRLGGSDRYDTARLVALTVASIPGTDATTALVASGENYPDALCASPVAARAGWPILLTRRAALPGATATALSQLGTDGVIVVGGEQAVEQAVFSALPSPERWAGPDRYATSRQVADRARITGLLVEDGIGFATGRAFPDALSAGPRAATEGIPVVLADSVTPALSAWLDGRGPITDHIVLHGGPAALPYDLEFDILTALRR